jgi:DNA-binding NarL/FixJ family response regulator
MKILIVDDHTLFRQGLANLLHDEPDMEVCGQAGTYAEAVDLAKKLRPETILMDYRLPDGNGVDAARAILAENPGCRIVFLTVQMDDEELFDAIRTGAKGYLLKSVPISTLLEDLRAIQAGDAVLSSSMTDRVLKEFVRLKDNHRLQDEVLALMTPREIEILEELTLGSTNKEIASHLFMAENTVKRHVHNILAKLGVRNRRAAAKWAREHGLE